MAKGYRKLHAVEGQVGGEPLAPATTPHELLPSLLPALRAFARRFIQDAEEARDVAQEVAIRALSAKKIPQERSAYRSWLYQITRNTAVDAFRRRALPIPPGPDPVSPSLADRSVINAVAVRQALQRISEDHRRILLLIDVEGLSYAEAAQRLRIPPGTVMSRIARARAALLALLVEEEAIR
ncbi:RNA polymerase sigma factor [Microvirga makkahensis]|uniref:Sigma-70 family RNA polymerase sigma factor n=1 Tax=Microvirga makkahensis TaxID=1128670 RepID=A0A7X3SRI6_9HYPH|nr:RNA polymerase sigma factor [Microvirga makkahensis]MXQ14104.1 sigma-70 family RNA polymerase sigma factor [Microvirga makkahensis]